MKLSKFSRSIDRLSAFVTWLDKSRDKIAIFFTIVVSQFLFIGVLSSVLADDTIQIDAVGTYGDMTSAVEDITDSGPSLQNLNSGNSLASMITASMLLFGSDSFAGADGEGVSTFTRRGGIAIVDDNVSALLYDPPGMDLPGHLARQWVPGQDTNGSVYAQMQGYTYLRDEAGVEGLWEMFRNIAYAGFVVILIVAGFMIMFRSKIGGQVTVGIMNTIPGVVIGLILVTFSFALVGVIMDFGRLLSLMIINYMGNVSYLGGFQPSALPPSFLGMFLDAFTAVPGVGAVGIGLGVGLVGGAIVGAIIGNVPGALIGTAIGGILPLLMLLIIALIALYAAIKVYVTLVMAYFKLLIDLIFGPVFILFGSLPGKSSSIIEWLKRVVSSTLVFPVVLFLVNLARYVGHSADFGNVTPISFLGGGDDSPEGILLLKPILVIVGYLMAAGAPGIINEALSVVESKGIAAAVEGVKKTAGKIPLIGGLFSG
ncbi:hypothetical protein JW710_03100 [Candidatus Dojkabacteria bacterium]|nr:hypothetical protein [Candidatus Dojkabacteria bacterium]